MPKRHLAILAAVVIVTAACGSTTTTSRRTVTSTTSAPATVSTKIPQRVLDALADRFRSSCQAPGAAIGVRTADGTNDYAVSGRFARGVALTRDGQFLAGSVTKLLVATVALRLVAKHDLALADHVDQFLPGWPRGDRITVAMLLGHRSGMGDFGNDFS